MEAGWLGTIDGVQCTIPSGTSVLDDLLEGWISREAATEIYGVAFEGCDGEDELAVDAAATETKRNALRGVRRAYDRLRIESTSFHEMRGVACAVWGCAVH